MTTEAAPKGEYFDTYFPPPPPLSLGTRSDGVTHGKRANWPLSPIPGVRTRAKEYYPGEPGDKFLPPQPLDASWFNDPESSRDAPRAEPSSARAHRRVGDDGEDIQRIPSTIEKQRMAREARRIKQAQLGKNHAYREIQPYLGPNAAPVSPENKIGSSLDDQPLAASLTHPFFAPSKSLQWTKLDPNSPSNTRKAF